MSAGRNDSSSLTIGMGGCRREKKIHGKHPEQLEGSVTMEKVREGEPRQNVDDDF